MVECGASDPKVRVRFSLPAPLTNLFELFGHWYIENQLKEDMMTDQITIKEYKDPFKG